jgi:hypothetical protein
MRRITMPIGALMELINRRMRMMITIVMMRMMMKTMMEIRSQLLDMCRL